MSALLYLKNGREILVHLPSLKHGISWRLAVLPVSALVQVLEEASTWLSLLSTQRDQLLSADLYVFIYLSKAPTEENRNSETPELRLRQPELSPQAYINFHPVFHSTTTSTTHFFPFCVSIHLQMFTEQKAFSALLTSFLRTGTACPLHGWERGK